ncbi:unnamed protein product [Symbiodinium microadriaticum]|nr:unnamed protein product [Symbiodinium microadriaticum]CAE7937862.1 unnamed protein product [Symbiodinium sp. KB8]
MVRKLWQVNEPSEEEPRLIQRRAPVRSTAENEVYVARNQSLAVLFKRIRRLFDREGHREVVIHGMGASITKAIYVAQDVLMHYGERLSLETHHGTVDVVDDVMGEYESTVEQRRVSSLTLHLRFTESEAGVAGVASRSRTPSLMNLIFKPD